MAPAEGSSSIMVIANELTFKSPPSLVVENCEDAWNEQVDGDCTATLDAADFKVGAGSAKFEIAVGCPRAISPAPRPSPSPPSHPTPTWGSG